MLLLPIIFYVVCSVLCLFMYILTKNIWNDPTRNILAFTAGTGNTGYFGIPVALALFGESAIGLMVISLIGYILYENTFGFFVVARGKHTAKESLQRLLRLPTLYASIAAIIINISGFGLGQDFFTFTANFTGAYSVLGMMLIGLGLAAAKKEEFDGKFIGLAFAAKFVLWPVLMLAIILADIHVFHLFNEAIHQVMMLLAIVPLAANTIAFAAALDAKPAKAAAAVFISTLFVLFYIPVMVAIFLK